jgi:hypothetical protein
MKPDLLVVYKSIQRYVLLSFAMLAFACYYPFTYIREDMGYTQLCIQRHFLYLIFVGDIAHTSSMYVTYDKYLSVSYLYSGVINIQKKFINIHTRKVPREHINAYVYFNWLWSNPHPKYMYEHVTWNIRSSFFSVLLFYIHVTFYWKGVFHVRGLSVILYNLSRYEKYTHQVCAYEIL